MASNTDYLGLLKKDSATDGNDNFNVDLMMNNNWDKIDTNSKENNDKIEALETQQGTNTSNIASLNTNKADKTGTIENANKLGGFVDTDYLRRNIDEDINNSYKFKHQTGKNMGDIDATPSGANNWNNRNNTSLLLTNSNNALSVIVGGVNNDRNAMVQVGHSSINNSQYLGNLHLNLLGGNVTVNGKKVVKEESGGYLDTNYLGKNATAKNTEKVGSVLAENVIDGKYLNNIVPDIDIINKGVSFNYLDPSNVPFPLGLGGSFTTLAYDSKYGSQIATDWDGNNMYIRSKNKKIPLWSDWAKVWTDANDGANSGLDADLFDGQHASYFATKTELNTKLGKTEKASDSNNLDGHDSTYFAKQSDMTSAKTDIDALKVKPSHKEIDMTISTGWIDSGVSFYKDVSNSLVRDTYSATLSFNYTMSSPSYYKTVKKDYNLIERAYTYNGKIRFYAYKKPTHDIPVKVNLIY